jgi:hypothetical protein
LNGCTPYAGTNPITLYPADQPYQLPATSWALSTVLTCALHIPLTPSTTVQVLKSPAYDGFEAPLTNADLSSPSPFADPQSQPVISTDNNENQNTYTRPWLGGSDANGADQVTQQGAPITIAVYENRPPLTVTASETKLSETATTMTMEFSATVTGPGGATIPALALSWSWSFGDGTSSTASTPTHSFASGTYPVTVQVTDDSAGSGGTDTIQVTAQTAPTTSAHGYPGGNTPTRSSSPVGPDHSRGTHPGGQAGEAKASHPATPTPTNAATETQTQTAASPPKPAAASSGAPVDTQRPAAANVRSPPSPAIRRPARAPHPAPSVQPRTLVSGRLIGDVTPLPPGAQLVTRRGGPPRAAAPVREATRIAPLPALLAGLAVLTLLALGAWRELRTGEWW